jgi:hypothetical protein
LLCKLPKTSSLCVTLSVVWRCDKGIAQESNDPHAVEFLFCGVAKQKRERCERGLARKTNSFRTQSNIPMTARKATLSQKAIVYPY